MLGLQGNSSSSKVHRCMACSATFTGLSSLLVHQATHANALAKVNSSETPEKAQNEEAVRASNLPSDQPTPPLPLPECSSFYICDCGEEFRDFNLMLGHKRSHIPTQQLLQPLNINVFHSVKEECVQDTSAHPEAPKKAVTLPVVPTSYPSTSVAVSSATEVVTSRDPVVDRTLPNHVVGVGIKFEDSTVSNPQVKEVFSADPDKVSCVLSVPEPRPTALHKSSNVKAICSPSMAAIQAGPEPKNKNLMKMLASAYVNRFLPFKNETPSHKEVIPKNETIPVEITSETTSDSGPHVDPCISPLRSQIRKSGPKSKSPTVGKILDASKKSIVSLTQTFSPVVLLETRQKLIDSSSNGTCGRYQCGRCRKVFQDLDSLTEHHFLHRKERIKCCRYCKQLIIGKLPFPDNHICAQSAEISIPNTNVKQDTLQCVQKPAIFQSLKQQSIIKAKKTFFCSICKHSYARRYNLKMHKCQGPVSLSQRGTTPFVKRKPQRAESKLSTNAQDHGSTNSKSVAVGTAVIGNIKVEVTPAGSGHSTVSDKPWSGSAKSFLPFYTRPAQTQHKDTPPGDCLLQQGEKESRETAVVPPQEENGGEWRVPLDDEMEVVECLMGADDDNRESKKTIPVAHVNKSPRSTLSFFFRDGAKRYPCNKCQKTYSRPSTLRRHLRLCGFRPHGTATAHHHNARAHILLGDKSKFASKVKPIFNCIFCGKSFNRKDNMMVHRKKCQMKREMSGMDRAALQQNHPVPKAEGPWQQQPQEESANWGVMSLPSVLPRRVTCECGAGFTSPKLLLEHLQKHAQESYTCPTCGETVASWADYEVHLQIHMHPHNHLYKALQPQRSQPLLLRFQQQPPPSQSAPQIPPKQPRAVPHPSKHPPPLQLPNQVKKQQRIVCMRCNNTFSNHCNLRKHITLNRCKGGRAAVSPKGTHCSRCNTHFPSIISLVFHQRSGACKLAVKPVRCTLCQRWFGTEDALQKHLLTHKQSQTFHCDICQGKYSSRKSLQNHRRKIHRLTAGGVDRLTLVVPKQE